MTENVIFKTKKSSYDSYGDFFVAIIYILLFFAL